MKQVETVQTVQTVNETVNANEAVNEVTVIAPAIPTFTFKPELDSLTPAQVDALNDDAFIEWSNYDTSKTEYFKLLAKKRKEEAAKYAEVNKNKKELAEKAKADKKALEALLEDKQKFEQCANNFDKVQINVRGKGLQNGTDYWFKIDNEDLRKALKTYLDNQLKTIVEAEKKALAKVSTTV